MSYYGSWKIDDLLTFAVNTQSPTTGAETDADAVPGYRVYEDETGTPILTGTMSLLDDANTVGFYSEQITLSAANGFEKGKCYNIRVRAVVGGIAASVVHNLQIEAEVDANTVSATNVSANMVQIGGVTQSATDLKDFADDGYDPSTNKVQGVVLTDTTTTYTGNTPQTGDSYALANGASGFVAIKTETASIQTDTNDIQARIPVALTGDGNIKADSLRWNGLATVELPLVPTTAGRKLDVSAGGEAGVDWANVGSPTTVLNLSGTTVKTATDVATATTALTKLLECDIVIDDSNPAQFVLRLYEKGTYGTTNVLLLSQDMQQMNGTPLTDVTTQRLGRKILE